MLSFDFSKDRFCGMSPTMLSLGLISTALLPLNSSWESSQGYPSVNETRSST